MTGVMQRLRVRSQRVPGLYEALRVLKHRFRARPRGRVVDLAADAALDALTLSQIAWDATGLREIDRVLRRFSRR